MEKEIILKGENLIKEYGNFKAVDDVSFEIRKGDLTVILGLSGSGKSTLLNMIGAMDKPTFGHVYYGNKDVTSLKGKELTEYRRNDIGFVFQAFNLINDITVKENITIQASLLKNHGDIDQVIDLVGLSSKKDNYPKELSGGEQQRVSIARALVKNSGIILCDEPTGALDYETGKKILSLIYDLSHKENKTIIFVTHTKEIAKMADHVICMRSGKIIEEYYNDSVISPDEIEW